MFYTEDYPDQLVLYEVDKIIQERWRNIERTTRYGWLTAISQRASISREDAKVLSTLACKIGYENSNKACHRIKKACRDLHPFDIPKMAMSVLDETYTALILNNREKEIKWGNGLFKDLPPTIFTISKDIF